MDERSKRYKTLLQRRADLEQERNGYIEQLDELLIGAGDDLTDDERATFDSLRSKIDGIDGQLDTVNADITREESARDLRRQAAARREPREDPVSISGLRDRTADDPRHGFANIVDFARAVHRASAPGGMAVVDDRLNVRGAPSNYLERGGDQGEGYLVPPEFRREIWEIVWNDPLMDRFDWEETESNEVKLLADETTPWGATGIVARWRSEGTQMTGQKFAVDPRSTRLHQLYAFVIMTNELLRDAPLMRGRMTRKAAEAIIWKIIEAFITGTGAGQPLGMLRADALVSIAKESGQSADTINANNVLKMYARMIFQGGMPFWVGNQEVLTQLPLMTIGDQPVWLPPTGLIAAPDGGILFGRPLYLSDHAEALGDQGDLIFLNPVGYHAVRRTTAPEFASSIHLFFDYNMEAFRWTFEVGGQPMLSAAISPAKGSSTRSHIVVIDDRA